MSSPENQLFDKPRVFDTEYTIKFILMCIIALGVILLSWTYGFKNNMIIPLNDSNENLFNDRFDNLSLSSEWGNYNISNAKQKVFVPKDIDRSKYNINRAVFGSLPLIPSDWGKMKYAFDQGKSFVLKSMNDSHFKQPEFYDDWDTMGLSFFKNHDMECSSGVFIEPYVQKIYTTHGVSIETYSFVRSSFCTVEAQAMSLNAVYPEYMESLAGDNYKQDPSVVKKYISIKVDPNSAILGSVYPKFSKDWAAKVKVTITVADNTPKGIYVVAIGAGKYDLWFGKQNNINYDSYKSKNGAPLAHYIIAVD